MAIGELLMMFIQPMHLDQCGRWVARLDLHAEYAGTPGGVENAATAALVP